MAGPAERQHHPVLPAVADVADVMAAVVHQEEAAGNHVLLLESCSQAYSVWPRAAREPIRIVSWGCPFDLSAFQAVATRPRYITAEV